MALSFNKHDNITPTTGDINEHVQRQLSVRSSSGSLLFRIVKLASTSDDRSIVVEQHREVVVANRDQAVWCDPSQGAVWQVAHFDARDAKTLENCQVLHGSEFERLWTRLGQHEPGSALGNVTYAISAAAFTMVTLESCAVKARTSPLAEKATS